MRHRNLLRVIAALMLVMITGSCGGGGGGDATGPGGGPAVPTGPGASWTPVTKPTGATSWFDVAYGNAKWVAVGSGARAVSNDGIAWTPTTITVSSYSFNTTVTFDNGIFVDVGSQGVSTSANGTSWSSQVLSNAQALVGAAYGLGTWVVADDRFLSSDVLAFMVSTTNGAGWSPVLTTIGYAQPTSVAFGNGTFVVVGYGSLVATSTNVTSWTKRTFPGTGDGGVLAVTYGGDKFVAVTNTGKAYRSADGITWTKHTIGVGAFYGVTYGNGQFVAVGNVGHIYVSVDGATWTKRTWTGGSNDLEGVKFGNAKFVAVGDEFAYSQ